jgi:hypothetical protein
MTHDFDELQHKSTRWLTLRCIVPRAMNIEAITYLRICAVKSSRGKRERVSDRQSAMGLQFER